MFRLPVSMPQNQLTIFVTWGGSVYHRGIPFLRYLFYPFREMNMKRGRIETLTVIISLVVRDSFFFTFTFDQTYSIHKVPTPFN